VLEFPPAQSGERNAIDREVMRARPFGQPRVEFVHVHLNARRPLGGGGESAGKNEVFPWLQIFHTRHTLVGWESLGGPRWTGPLDFRGSAAGALLGRWVFQASASTIRVVRHKFSEHAQPSDTGDGNGGTDDRPAQGHSADQRGRGRVGAAR